MSSTQDVKVGDIWEGKAGGSRDWASALRFQVDCIKGQSATLRSIPDGDVSSTPISFATVTDIWRLVKRQGSHTFCQDCNP